MQLRPEQCQAFYSHFPVPDSLTLDERLAVLELSEKFDINYFVSNEHIVTAEYGQVLIGHDEQRSARYCGELLLKAS